MNEGLITSDIIICGGLFLMLVLILGIAKVSRTLRSRTRKRHTEVVASASVTAEAVENKPAIGRISGRPKNTSMDERTAKLSNWRAQVDRYLQEQNIVSALGQDNVQFAVISVRKCDTEAIQRLALELAGWVKQNGEVQIFGLAQMLEGAQPEVAAHLFSIPMLLGSSYPKQWTQSVALVVHANNHKEPEEKLAASLSKVVNRHEPARIESYEAYCYQSR